VRVLEEHRERAVDAAVALVAFGLTLALLLIPEDEGRSLDALGVVLAAAASLPLLARRRAPLAVFVVTVAASSALFALDYPGGPPIGPTVALYTVALLRVEILGSQLLTIAFTAVLFASHVGANAIANGFEAAAFVLGAPLWAAAWFAGDRTRLRRERIAELEERAVRAEREAARERRLAAAEERTRIARDLHDSAGHAINVILVQAGAARLLAEKDPDRARDALETIETVARETLTDIDRLVRVLREDADGEVEPPAGLAALESIAGRHRSAGLDVDVVVGGRRRPLPPAVDQAAFRIVQESLTNALLHGSGGVDVAIDYGDDALAIAVTNPVAAGETATGGGHGIVGMRERALLVGGGLEAAREDGAFRVRATLPYAEGRA
jgi:signal transduction histidine kinase